MPLNHGLTVCWSEEGTSARWSAMSERTWLADFLGHELISRGPTRNPCQIPANHCHKCQGGYGPAQLHVDSRGVDSQGKARRLGAASLASRNDD